MTVVAGYTNGKEFAIAADSGAFDEAGQIKMTVAEAKVWFAGNSLQGGAGNFRALEVARRANIENPQALSNYLMEANIAGEWSILVVNRRGVYELGEDGSVVRFKEPYGSIGAGGTLALGALAAEHRAKIGTPAAIVRIALDVCVRHSSACSTPVCVLSN